MNIDTFSQQMLAMSVRLNNLYNDFSQTNVPSLDFLPVAFKELGVASEELQVATEELRRQNEELFAAKEMIEIERKQYQDLFDFAPDGYIVTNLEGIIQQANRAAASMLQVASTHIVGKPLPIYIAAEDRYRFRCELNQLPHQNRKQELPVRLQGRNSEAMDATLTVSVVRDLTGRAIALRWLVRDVTERKRSAAALTKTNTDISSDRPKYCYTKGEVIPLNPREIWQAIQGVVKLTTLNDCGEEVLVGLAGAGMPFGLEMTSLPTYQAIALSHVQVVSFSLVEITSNPVLMKAIAPKINARLKQAEGLLAITGQRRVKDRLHNLLHFLKREIGEPVEQGIRLSVRFTHEELASACCSTRVTITRQINKLQQQGAIAIDSKSHIILKESRD